MERIIGWFRKIQNPITRLSRSESTKHFHDLLDEQEIRVDKMTLNLIEEIPSGPYWDIKVEGDENFSLFSDSLIINLGPKRPAIKFTKANMTTQCPKCSGEVRYGVQGKVPNWWCIECGHHKLDEETSSPTIIHTYNMIH